MSQPVSHYKLTDLCEISLGGKLLQIKLHNGLFDVEQVERVMDRIDELTGGKEYRVLIDCEPSARTTFRALKTMSKARAMRYAIAKAYVISSLHQRFMANVFLLFFSPPKPVRFFSDRNKALSWLEEMN